MNYPNGIKKDNSISLSTLKNSKNRGMTLENDLNETNEYYREEDIAIIYKKPTPIKIVKVDYPSRNEAKIKEAFFTVPSTTDYNGLYKGKYIDFDAKETENKTSFPLANVQRLPEGHSRLQQQRNAKECIFLKTVPSKPLSKSNQAFPARLAGQ